MEVLSSRVLLRPYDRAVTTAFYRDVLGLAIAREFPGGTVFFAGQGYIEVSGTGSGEPCEGVQLWLQVRDVDATARDLSERGATIVREPRTEPWGLREMWITDPDGVRIGVVQVPEGHPIRTDVRPR